jgi:hypothetical protein
LKAVTAAILKPHPSRFAEKFGECRQIASPMPLRAHLNAHLNMIAAWT